MHAYICMHTYACIHMHACMQTCAYMQAYAYICMHASYACMYTYACMAQRGSPQGELMGELSSWGKMRQIVMELMKKTKHRQCKKNICADLLIYPQSSPKYDETPAKNALAKRLHKRTEYKSSRKNILNAFLQKTQSTSTRHTKSQ